MTQEPPALTESPGRGEPAPTAVGDFGMAIFLVSLSVLFIACLVAYIVVRNQADQWPPAGAPPLPSGLWFNTLVLVVCSVTVHLAFVSIRKGCMAKASGFLTATGMLGTLFLVLQALSWREIYSAQVPDGETLFEFTFIVLTGLHALHVVGGLVLIGWVATKAFQGRYTSARHPGVRYSVAYWHFLDAAWLVIFAILMTSS
jgi:heme/copper-type cytochrome/quinol oxidase subunit 3